MGVIIRTTAPRTVMGFAYNHACTVPKEAVVLKQFGVACGRRRASLRSAAGIVRVNSARRYPGRRFLARYSNRAVRGSSSRLTKTPGNRHLLSGLSNPRYGEHST